MSKNKGIPRKGETVVRKRGALSTTEMEFITKSAPIMTAAEIGVALGRNPDPIKKYIKAQNLKSKEVSDHEYMYLTFLNKLRTQPYYKYVVEQLTEDELNYFEDSWIKLVSQFKDDILYSEEMQIKQWIMIEISINRVQMERKKCATEIEEIEEAIAQEREKGDERNSAEILNMEHKMSYTKAAIGAYSGEYTKLLDKAKEIQRELKMARADRVKKFEDPKSNFATMMQMLDEREHRIKWGDDIELSKLAGDKAAAELAEYHTYVDGSIDQPLLTPDTVIGDNQEERA
jgi:hypothetical protein